jgi:putative colanic acid biosynthesis UDP-glucose lipid carrier transferase
LMLYPLLFPLLMLMIRLDSKGPLFFRQKRVGFMGRVFVCYKFRTMQVNDQADIKSAVDEDIRITRIGKFLRKTCLDELPQFINVLAGDMSVVGPRPHMLVEYTNSSNKISDYYLRTLARPGITGLAQVIGYRGPAASFRDIYYRYHWDLFYMRRGSLKLDLWIMAKTAAIMVGAISNREKASAGSKSIVLNMLVGSTSHETYEHQLNK